MLFFNSNTSQTLSGEGDLQTEEKAVSEMLAKAGENQDSLNDSGMTDSEVSGVTTREEDVGLVDNNTFLRTDPFLPNIKVIFSLFR